MKKICPSKDLLAKEGLTEECCAEVLLEETQLTALVDQAHSLHMVSMEVRETTNRHVDRALGATPMDECGPESEPYSDLEKIRDSLDHISANLATINEQVTRI